VKPSPRSTLPFDLVFICAHLLQAENKEDFFQRMGAVYYSHMVQPNIELSKPEPIPMPRKVAKKRRGWNLAARKRQSRMMRARWRKIHASQKGA
jgi:hypothetical protein